MAGQSTPTVLIVDDEPGIRTLYRDYLAGEYDVALAESGEAALERLDEAVDIALIDRRMPGMSGDQLVGRIREQGYDFPMAMVTALEPDFDVIELGFDDYIVKPVSADELTTLAESLVLRREYDDVLREYFSLASKATALRRSKADEELQRNEDYRGTIDRLNVLRRSAIDSLDVAVDNSKLEELLWSTFLDARDEPATGAGQD